MPGRRQPSNPVDSSLCRRCQILEPSIVVRTEPLCRDCFNVYVSTKIVKRMGSFRVRHAEYGQERKLLLPFSFDASSLALLHVLSHQLKGQAERTRRTGFQLHVLHVTHNSPEADDSDQALLAKVKSRYPEHEYTTAFLSQVMTSDNTLASLLDGVEGVAAKDDLPALLASTKSATARQDLGHILEERLVVRQAKENDCEGVIWPHTTTRLAQRILAATAKGRGVYLPWIVTDGESPHGIPFYNPLQELLTSELEAFVSFIEPLVDRELIKEQAAPPVSTKNTTIDDLMKQYFVSVERDFPSIVANVVKTTGKLQAPSLQQVQQQCELCNMPLEGQAPAKSRLCHGCIRTLPLAD